MANASRSSVQRTLRIFAAKGLDGVRSFGWKGQPRALTSHRATIEEELRKHPPHLVTEINTTYITATSVCALLGTIANRGGSVPVTLVMDNARYQRCVLVTGLTKALGIELLFVPSYSPNLNRIERLWKFVKKEVLNSRHHQNVQKFQEAIAGCLA